MSRARSSRVTSPSRRAVELARDVDGRAQDPGVEDPTAHLTLADRLDLQAAAARLPDGALSELRSLAVQVSTQRRRRNEAPIATIAHRWAAMARRHGTRRDVRVVVANAMFKVAPPPPLPSPVLAEAPASPPRHSRLYPRPMRRVREEPPRVRDIAAAEAKIAAAQARVLAQLTVEEQASLQRAEC